MAQAVAFTGIIVLDEDERLRLSHLQGTHESHWIFQ